MDFTLGKDDTDIPPNCTSIASPHDSKLFFLCNFLQHNTTITDVDIGRLGSGDEGAKAIAVVLKLNRTITKLDLKLNKIGVKGAKALAEALKVNCTLKELNLYCNEIGVEGAKAIAEALKVNHTVKILKLGDNQIGVEGAKAIADALKVNFSVKELDLSGNQIGNEGKKAIAEAVEINKSNAKANLLRVADEDEEKEEEEEEETKEEGKKVIPRVFYNLHEGNAFVKVHRKHVEVCDRFDWDVPSELQNQDFWNSNQTAKVTFRETDVVITQTFSKMSLDDHF